MMRRRAWLGFPLLIGGCSLLPERPYREVRNWPLVVSPPPPRPPAKTGVLLVRPVSAAAGLETRGLKVLRADGSLFSDPYEEWVAPPADAMSDQLQRWLAGSGVFAAVVAPGSRLNATYALEVELTAFWAVPAANQARVMMSYVLIAQRGDGASALLQSTITGVADLPDDSPEARAKAELAALSQAFAALTTGLSAQSKRVLF